MLRNRLFMGKIKGKKKLQPICLEGEWKKQKN